MALEHNNTALEFETMLRRHLARGGAMVAACAGFDADAASAYLEGALAGAPRATYEAHLAGCPACRRHVVLLSRLSHSLTPTPNTPAITPRGLWEQLQTTLAAWFDPGEWHWQWAPATAAAGALVLAVLAAQLWQQPQPSGSDTASVALQATVNNQAPAASPTPAEAVLDNPAAPLPPSVIKADAKDVARQGVPKPEVEPQQVSGNLPVMNLPPPAATMQSAADFSRAAGQAPVEMRSFAREQIATLPAPPPPIVTGLAPLTVSSQTAFRFESPATPAAAEPDTPQPVIAARMSPPAEENPARRGKVKLQPTNSNWRNRVLGYMPLSKADAERKAAPAESNENIAKPMAVRINDKLFRFEQGVLVDQAYKPEMQWRVLKLTRGSREYEQVLAAEPQLKEFFARGSIVIVWKDKIYKVVGQ